MRSPHVAWVLNRQSARVGPRPRGGRGPRGRAMMGPDPIPEATRVARSQVEPVAKDNGDVTPVRDVRQSARASAQEDGKLAERRAVEGEGFRRQKLVVVEDNGFLAAAG